mgnify:CR=1 FL=1
MNNIKWDEIFEIVESDCTGYGKLLDSQGRTCILGALGRAAGVSDEDLLERKYEVLYVAIMERFGLDLSSGGPASVYKGTLYRFGTSLHLSNDSVKEDSPLAIKKRRQAVRTELERIKLVLETKEKGT